MNSSPVLLASCLVFLLISCSLAAHDRITTKVTWDREIAPIVQARCVSCHSAGGRAPMALTTYEEARPWAKAIKEEVLARRMPKWHASAGTVISGTTRASRHSRSRLWPPGRMVVPRSPAHHLRLHRK